MHLGNSSRSNVGLSMSDEHMEQENDRLVSNLSHKVSHLKSLAVDIESEAKYQNKYQLGGMEEEFESLKGYMGTSVSRVTKLLSSGGNNRRIMCYMILALVGIFFFGYYILGRFSR